MDVGDDILTVDRQPVALGPAQRGMQDGAVLRDVDVLPGEHGVTATGHVDLLGQLGQGVAHLIGQKVLRQVHEEIPQLVGVAPGTAGVLGEPGAQVGAEVLMKLGELDPGGCGGGVDGRNHEPSLNGKYRGMGSVRPWGPPGRGPVRPPFAQVGCPAP